MKTVNVRFSPILLVFVLMLGGLSPGFAQQDQDTFMLEEMTVTAEKREENVQKTPISITAITGADIRENAQATLESVLRDVPALTIQKSPQGGQIYIRALAPMEIPTGSIPALPLPWTVSTPDGRNRFLPGCTTLTGWKFSAAPRTP